MYKQSLIVSGAVLAAPAPGKTDYSLSGAHLRFLQRPPTHTYSIPINPPHIFICRDIERMFLLRTASNDGRKHCIRPLARAGKTFYF